MAYDIPRYFSWDFKGPDIVGAYADNRDVFDIIIPANREVEIQNMFCFIRAISTDNTHSVELTDDSTNVLAQVFLGTTGFVAAKAAGALFSAADLVFPVKLAPQSTSLPSSLRLRTNNTLSVTADFTIQVGVSGLC